MSDETKLYNFRLPIALMDRVKAKAGLHGVSLTDVVLDRLRTFADEEVNSGTTDEAAAEIAMLKQLVGVQAKKIEVLEAAIAQGTGGPIAPLVAAAPTRKGSRPLVGRMLLGNPVQDSPVPPVVGEASGYRPKASWKGKP